MFSPDDADYDRWAIPWNLAVPSTPAAVVLVADADDVAETIRFAGAHGLRVDVRATGHGAAPVGDDTLLIRTDHLDEIAIHPQGWARVGAGVRMQRLIEAGAPHGLAPLSGSSPAVSVVGFVTGGGVGPVSRTFGLGSDHVRAIEVVTGDGAVRRATAASDAQLFRALRGARGAVGVVTAVEVDLLPIRTLYGGALYFDGADTRDILRAWLAWSKTLPELGSTTVAVLNLPPLPAVPAPLAGRTTVAVRFAWTGDASDGAAALAPIRAVAPVILGEVEDMPYTQIGSIHSDAADPMPTWESAATLDDLSDDAMDAVASLVTDNETNPQLLVEIRRLGGALARSPEHEDVITLRAAAYGLLTVGVVGDATSHGAVRRHADRLQTALAPWTVPGGLANLSGAANVTSVRANYDRATIDRLVDLVESTDPDRVLSQADALRAASTPATA